MKAGQGVKNRSTYPEARYGVEGIVGLFLAKQKDREMTAQIIHALDKHLKRSAVQSRFLLKQKKKLAELNDDIAHIMQHAPSEYPTFLEGLTKAHKVKEPAYPDEVRVLEKYAYLAYIKPSEKRTLAEMKRYPFPAPVAVSYGELQMASQNENGSPDKFQFSRIVKRYGLELKRGKPGRKAQVARRDTLKKSL
jgi:hypothetical protein